MRAASFAGAVVMLLACSRHDGSNAEPKEPMPAAPPAAEVPEAERAHAELVPSESEPLKPRPDPLALKRAALGEFGTRAPHAWGQSLPGITTRLETKEKVVALTFDACSGGYDEKLVEFLVHEHIAATLFVTGTWIDGHRETFAKLAQEPLFEIANHGRSHRPCSVNGRAAYGIGGTRSVADAVDEIQENALKIESVTHKFPAFFRSGTAFYDDVCVAIVGHVGEGIAGYSVLGDGGAGFSRAQVRAAVGGAPDGSIVILHMNHPEGATAEGVIDAVPALKQRGVRFVKLSDTSPAR